MDSVFFSLQVPVAYSRGASGRVCTVGLFLCLYCAFVSVFLSLVFVFLVPIQAPALCLSGVLLLCSWWSQVLLSVPTWLVVCS